MERAAKLEEVVRELQPDCLISGRLGGESQSDYDSEGDNAIPELSRAGAWETPATLNDTLGLQEERSQLCFLADPQRASLTVSQQGERVTIALPGESPDPIATVLCLDVAASPATRVH